LDEFDETIDFLYNKKQQKDKILKNLYNFYNSDIDKNKLEEIHKQISKIKQNLDLTDLLTFIQGPIPNQGMIIVATTNDFDKIKRICPALVRDGRFTRIKFDYPDQTIIEQISEFYFNKPLGFTIPKLIGIPTSKIVHKCCMIKMNSINNKINNLSNHNKFCNFIKEITNKLSSTIIS